MAEDRKGAPRPASGQPLEERGIVGDLATGVGVGIGTGLATGIVGQVAKLKGKGK
jgi:hypothetical protein